MLTKSAPVTQSAVLQDGLLVTREDLIPQNGLAREDVRPRMELQFCTRWSCGIRTRIDGRPWRDARAWSSYWRCSWDASRNVGRSGRWSRNASSRASSSFVACEGAAPITWIRPRRWNNSLRGSLRRARIILLPLVLPTELCLEGVSTLFREANRLTVNPPAGLEEPCPNQCIIIRIRVKDLPHLEDILTTRDQECLPRKKWMTLKSCRRIHLPAPPAILNDVLEDMSYCLLLDPHCRC